MRDPYEVLSVSREASDDEIKKAYRALSRKYHPDANVNNPNKAQAEEKFKEIQQAYQRIMDARQRGTESYEHSDNRSGQGGYADFDDFFGGFGFGGFGTFGGFGGQTSQRRPPDEDEYTLHMKAVYNYIQNRHFAEALNALNSVRDRTAQWYYYSSIANAGRGNNVIAAEHAKKAVAMEPGNYDYQNWQQQLESGGSWYQTRQSPYGMPQMGGNNFCLKLCIANLICNMCCGGGGLCCGGGMPIGRF